MVSAEPRSTSSSPLRSLRAKIAVGVALPILLMMSSISLIHYWRERHLVETQIQMTARQLGDLMTGSLRHAMEINDSNLLTQILTDVEGMDSIRQVQIIDQNNRVKVDSLRKGVGAIRNLDDPGCVECHQLPAKSQPQTIRLSTPSDVLRIATPIANGETCVRCHSQQNAHLGVLLVDVSVSDVESHLLNDLRVDLLFSAGMTVLITLGIYVLIHRLVVRRVAALQHPLTEFASGKFNARLPVSLAPSDEIDALTDAFNHMAGELERQAREQQAIGELRQRAIMEERERIARELHDGMAQLLGYVNTKAMAVRLMLKNRQMEAADKHLLQLEEAARELFVDVREAILGLKVTGQNGAGLPAALREFTTQFSRLSDIPVELNIASEADGLPLTAEMELQLLRIVQESLTNIRKHAAGTHASVNLQLANGILELTICDDGVGFESGPSRATRWPHVGLSTMRERAEAIGADFRLDSMPGAGTRVTVQLNLEANLACVS